MHRLRLLFALGLPLAIAACGGGSDRGQSAVPLPHYGIGDSYRFDDGAMRTVTGVSGEQVVWHGSGGATLVSTRDVLLPALAENTPATTVRRHMETPGLFPLVPGRHVTFVADTEWQPHAGPHLAAQQAWDCDVGDHVPVTTPAGSFDTIRVDCSIRNSGGARVVHRTYFYAPAIAYYVRRDDRVGDAPAGRVELVHAASGNPVLADGALLARSHAIQEALEQRVSGMQMAWRDPADASGGSVEPVLTERSPRFGWCREFREKMKISGRDFDLLGTACRDNAGTWLVRQVTPFATAAR